MPDYKHLEDGTPVTAEEFNTRFDTLMGEDKGVNQITPDMLALGALRHNQIPSLIGKEGEAKDDLAGGFTSETTRRFIAGTGIYGVEVTSHTWNPHVELAWEEVYRHTFRQPIGTDNAGRLDADAIILLANIHVNRLEKRDAQTSDDAFKGSMRERRIVIAFRFAAEFDLLNEDGVSLGTEFIPIRNSERGVSPGFTIDRNENDGLDQDSGYPMFEGSSYDYMTFKDVALRAVLPIDPVSSPSVFPGYQYTSIRIEACMFGSGTPFVKARLDKMNLTAIPLHTKVAKHGGS